MFLSGKKGKKKGVARKQELNRRGDKMGGSDMDAFADLKPKEEQQQRQEERPAEAAESEAATPESQPQKQTPEKQVADEKPVIPVEQTDSGEKADVGQAVDSVDAAAAVKKPDMVSGPPPASSKPSDDGAKAVPAPAVHKDDKKQQQQQDEKVPEAFLASVPSPAVRDDVSFSSPEVSEATTVPEAAAEEVEATPPTQPPAEPARPKLKYDYREDQWSPLNQEGKKQYDRDFLLQLRKDPLSMDKPPNLPNMEIVKDKPMDRTKMASSQMKIGQPTDWMPAYVKPTMSKVGLTGVFLLTL